MQRCDGKDKAAASAMPHHAKGKATASAMPHHPKGKATASAMPYHAKDKAAICSAMGPKHVDNIVQEQLAPPDRIRQRGLNSGKEIADTRTSGQVKHLGKERSSLPVMGLCREMSQKQGVDTPDLIRRQTQGIQRPVKSLASNTSLKQREKVGAGPIPQVHNAKEKTYPPDQLRRQAQGIQRPVKTEARLAGERKHKTEAHIAGEKKHTKSNSTSFPTKRTTPPVKEKTSSCCSDECTSRPVDAQDSGNTVVIQEQSQESAAIKIGKDVEYITQKMNKLGVRDDIDFEEHYECLMKLPRDPSIDTSKTWYTTSSYDMDIRHAVYRIKSYKLSQKESKNELCCDELKDCPMELLDRDEFPEDFLEKMQYFKFLEQEGVLDWFFHP